MKDTVLLSYFIYCKPKVSSSNLLHLSTCPKASSGSSLINQSFNDNNAISTNTLNDDSHEPFKRPTNFITNSVLVSRSVSSNALTMAPISNEIPTEQNYENEFSMCLGSLTMANKVLIKIKSIFQMQKYNIISITLPKKELFQRTFKHQVKMKFSYSASMVASIITCL